MAGKSKGGREIRKAKVDKPKGNASQPSVKGIAGAPAGKAAKRPGAR